ncbi:MAG TPA: hypothetical protein VLU96_11085 [Gaiellaceae bacterium]|nr:hypothetical protein [Gaiellaceae bacterium]
MRFLVVAPLVLAAVLIGTALGAASLVSPPPGAKVSTSRPTFSWTLPTNEHSEELDIADVPDLESTGSFVSANVVQVAIFKNDERQWTPTSPLYAGHYWWLVQSSDFNHLDNHYSAPTDFTVPVSLSILPIRTVRSTYLNLLAMKVRWTANVHTLTLRLRLLRKKRVIWKQTESEPNLIGSTGAKTVGWYRPRGIKRGARLTLQVTLLAGGAKKTRVHVVRAP